MFSCAETKSEVHDEKINTKIQVALLLDTSNSMDGLIDQAKSLWDIVNTHRPSIRAKPQRYKLPFTNTETPAYRRN